MQVLSNSLDYDRRPGFVADDYRNRSCIVVVQFQNNAQTSPEVDLYMPRAYKHVKRVTLKRVEFPSTAAVPRIFQFQKADGSDLFPTVQRATDANVTQKGFLVNNGRNDLVLANYRDSDGHFDYRMRLTQSPWVDALSDYRTVITFELELALWQ